MNRDNNSWNEWSRHVLAELKRLNGEVENIDKKLTGIQMDIIALKTKAAAFGAAAAVAVTLAASVMKKMWE